MLVINNVINDSTLSLPAKSVDKHSGQADRGQNATLLVHESDTKEYGLGRGPGRSFNIYHSIRYTDPA